MMATPTPQEWLVASRVHQQIQNMQFCLPPCEACKVIAEALAAERERITNTGALPPRRGM